MVKSQHSFVIGKKKINIMKINQNRTKIWYIYQRAGWPISSYLSETWTREWILSIFCQRKIVLRLIMWSFKENVDKSYRKYDSKDFDQNVLKEISW